MPDPTQKLSKRQIKALRVERMKKANAIRLERESPHPTIIHTPRISKAREKAAKLKNDRLRKNCARLKARIERISSKQCIVEETNTKLTNSTQFLEAENARLQNNIDTLVTSIKVLEGKVRHYEDTTNEIYKATRDELLQIQAASSAAVANAHYEATTKIQQAEGALRQSNEAYKQKITNLEAHHAKQISIARKQAEHLKALARNKARLAACNAGSRRLTSARLNTRMVRFNNLKDKASKEELKLAQCTISDLSKNREELRQRLSCNHRHIRALEKLKARLPTRFNHVVQKIKDKSKLTTRVRATPSGHYSLKHRKLARYLVAQGLAVEKVGRVLYSIAAILGAPIDHEMSPRTVQRIVEEGQVAARMQAGYEMGKASYLCYSSDATKHKNVEKDAKHVTLPVGPEGAPASRFLGIDSLRDHASATQVESLRSRLGQIEDTFNQSPLAKSLQHPFVSNDFVKKMVATSGDHANDQRCNNHIYTNWKKDVVVSDLGEEYLTSLLPEEYFAIVLGANKRAMENVGGIEAFMAQPAVEQDKLTWAAVRETARRFGSHSFEQLPEEDKAAATQIIHAGCHMHKDMNTFKGGVQAMEKIYATHPELAKPCLLPSKDSAEAMRLSPDSAIAKHAEKESHGGAVKATLLGGLIFHHTNEKKGQQDIYRIYFREHISQQFHYPPTCSTRYGSNAKASGQIVSHRPTYISFMDNFIRFKKQDGRNQLTNVEENFLKSLYDLPTLIEHCVCACYDQCFSNAYMTYIRGQGPSAVSLETQVFIQGAADFLLHLAENPALVLAADASYKDATLNSQPWEKPEVMLEVKKISLEHKEVYLLFSAFFRGAYETFLRFNSEYFEGGAIYHATVAQRSFFVPTTNDINESALGRMRRMLHRFPSRQMNQVNGIMMYAYNNTAAFEKEHVADKANQTYIRAKARANLELKVDHTNEQELLRAITEENTRKVQKKAEKETKQRQELDKLGLVELKMLDEEIDKLSVAQLDAQLGAYVKVHGVKGIPAKSKWGNKDAKKRLVKKSRDDYQKRGGSSAGGGEDQLRTQIMDTD